jgi:hypothetical protein
MEAHRSTAKTMDIQEKQWLRIMYDLMPISLCRVM